MFPHGKYLKPCVMVLALIPIAGGLSGLVTTHALVAAHAGDPAYAMLDSNLRFLSGVWFALGIGLFLIRNRLHEPSLLFQTVLAGVTVGGAGRLFSAYTLETLPAEILFFLAIELVLIPYLMLWQFRFSRRPV